MMETELQAGEAEIIFLWREEWSLGYLNQELQAMDELPLKEAVSKPCDGVLNYLSLLFVCRGRRRRAKYLIVPDADLDPPTDKPTSVMSATLRSSTLCGLRRCL